jgi:hypothetical protein
MKRPFLPVMVIGILACVASLVAQAPLSPAIPADARNYTTPKTPWAIPISRESGPATS